MAAVTAADEYGVSMDVTDVGGDSDSACSTAAAIDCSVAASSKLKPAPAEASSKVPSSSGQPNSLSSKGKEEVTGVVVV